MEEVSLFYLELTSGCNSKCASCDYWKEDAPKEFSDNLLYKTLENIKMKKINNLIITGGEPLLHPNFIHLMKKIQASTDAKFYTLMTNGILLKKYENTIVEAFDRIIVSLDGFDTESYKSTRGVDTFTKVVNNIEYFKKRHKNLEIRIKTTIHPPFESRFLDFVNLAKDLGVDSISFNALDNSNTNAFNRYNNDIKMNQPSLKLYNKDILFDQLDKVIHEDNEEILFENKETLVKLFERSVSLNRKFPVCNALDNTIIIHANGDVRLCFFSKVVGNILTNPLDVIIKSSTVKKMKSDFNNKVMSECFDCVCPYFVKDIGGMPYRS